MKRMIRFFLQFIAAMLVVSAPSCSKPDQLLPELAHRLGTGLGERVKNSSYLAASTHANRSTAGVKI